MTLPNTPPTSYGTTTGYPQQPQQPVMMTTTGYQQQQTVIVSQQVQQPMMIITTSAANTPLSVVQFANGPLVETLSESLYLDGNSGFALPTQLSHTLSLYGVQNSGALVAEMEQVVSNLNGMLREHYTGASKYDIGFWVSFTVIMILTVLTMGLAVGILFIMYIPLYKKSRYLLSNMNRVVRPKIQQYLTEFNRTKLIPLGLELVLSFIPAPSAFSATQTMWIYSSTSTERIVLKLIRVSKPVPTAVMQ
ncbi:hypothetical protein C9374_007543 [Naegleria lovaniensis]|uniref:Uncharacterized protein n=1 Tax=Naegleria lovaniensis TaxID=51637 RepID=A0AA88GHB1_NAELO|nr:uncharacterized protein C9374_007543 [Naegleria lovaniensis]KAG2379404.1 hypothetical protein C9374_007543 [Naegleria lovaniensis]